MSKAFFRVQERTCPVQHIREYPDATARNQNEVLHLSIKQYIPLDRAESPPSDALTIVAAHANGFPKELYEPLWDEIYESSKSFGFTIRSIWIADAAHQGKSGIINEDKLGNDPSWNDLARDLLYMINHFREDMPRPLMGVGHSFGGCALVNLSLMHPRLLSGLILIDPVIQLQAMQNPKDTGSSVAVMSTFRKDIWPSRQAAAASFQRSPFYKAWDPRALDLWVEYGLRDLPTKLYPDVPTEGEKGTPVTLTTTKHQEVWTFLRPNFDGQDADGNAVYNRLTHADLNRTAPPTYPFYRPEPSITLNNLQFLRPPVLYIFGGKSNVSTEEWREQKLELTGTGVGGSGGAKEGRVEEVTLPGISHLVPMEAPEQTAEAAATWLGRELQRWRDQEQKLEAARSQREAAWNIKVSEEWIKRVGPPPTQRRKNANTKL
ncbi:MAG: hypothetical protein MMC33_010425 [Icmadophila ericetorum]|nr:hypothetical protein [Icmadophila ericetorum]